MFICFWFSCPGTIKYNNWSHWLFHNPIKEVILKKNNGKEKDLPPRIHVYKINYKINFNYQFEVFFFLIFLFVPLLPKFRRTYLLLLNILFSLKLLGWNLYHSKKKMTFPRICNYSLLLSKAQQLFVYYLRYYSETSIHPPPIAL